jgi:hypothetical protein
LKENIMRKIVAISVIVVAILAAYTLAARAETYRDTGWLDRYDTCRPYHHGQRRMIEPFCLQPRYQDRCDECHRDAWQKRAELDRKLERLAEENRQKWLNQNGYKTYKGPSWHWGK